MSDIDQAMWDTQQAALREPMKSIRVLTKDEAELRGNIARTMASILGWDWETMGQHRKRLCDNYAVVVLNDCYEGVEKITAASEHLWYSQTEGWKACRDYVLALLKGGQP